VWVNVRAALHFAAFHYLSLLWLVPALLLLYGYAFWRKRQMLRAFVNTVLAPRLLPGFSRTRQWCKALCLVSAVGCMVLALMQPQWGKDRQKVPRRGRDLVILLDVSLSMLAEDAVPNRLEYAKTGVRELVQVLQQEGGHRLGLVAFAGHARLLCPLTLDYAFFLQQLHNAGIDTIDRAGTAIGDALRQALHGSGILQPGYTDMILLTDGEDHQSLPLESAQLAASLQVSVYTIGIGDADTGALIPLPDAKNQPRSYVQYRGKAVRSRMQQRLLLEIAQHTRGAYMPAGTHALGLDRMYREHIAPKPRRDLDVATREDFVHRYAWFVLVALLFLAVEMLVRERKAGMMSPGKG
jgi:Ca-activated chloride channel family protein